MTHENYEATLWELVDVTLFSVVLGDFCPAWGIYTYTYIYIMYIYTHKGYYNIQQIACTWILAAR